MKTDLIEIFQTIRAALQPYAVLGFTNRTNSEILYDLWSEKNITVEGEQRTESFFGSVSIAADHVLVSTGFEHKGVDGQQDVKIKTLDEVMINQIEEIFATGFKKFKENEWV
ncbi:hypothetical protein IWX76_000263 [Pedobacter sp. CAN_A7]|uniref:hypothetical protein n=1 Tax=Pedobacter sp. CAN_A7 TaxID=2787722 RepID=UPI0018CADD7E